MDYIFFASGLTHRMFFLCLLFDSVLSLQAPHLMPFPAQFTCLTSASTETTSNPDITDSLVQQTFSVLIFVNWFVFNIVDHFLLLKTFYSPHFYVKLL